MSNQPNNVTRQADEATLAVFPGAMAVNFALPNMDGPNDARLLYNGLMAVQGVSRVDVFYVQGIVVVIYNRHQVSPAELCRAVEQIGTDTSQFFSAEVIGESSAREALESK
jgi:copper chaperone CopZ